MLGLPRRHFRITRSTSAEAVVLGAAGAPHGTMVTADQQTAGRGRQGRRWHAPVGGALLMSLVLREHDRLLPLRAGLAVAAVVGPSARLKWPNDVLLDGRKVAGILVEAFPRRGWAVLGIGVNVAVDTSDLPPAVRATAATLASPPECVEPLLLELLAGLERQLAASPADVLAEWARRDALKGRPVAWAGGRGIAAGLDETGSLRVRGDDGALSLLDAGEVHLLG